MHADYKITDKLGITLGARQSEDRKKFEGGQQDLNMFFYKIAGCYPYNASGSLIGAPANLTCQQALGFQPRESLSDVPARAEPSEFQRVHADGRCAVPLRRGSHGDLSYAKGFKTGGWTTRLTAPLPPGSPAQSFGPETDHTFELGLKSEWFDRHLIVNAATFYSKYEGIQLTYQVITSPVTQNAGNARVQGLKSSRCNRSPAITSPS